MREKMVKKKYSISRLVGFDKCYKQMLKNKDWRKVSCVFRNKIYLSSGSFVLQRKQGDYYNNAFKSYTNSICTKLQSV